MKVFLRSSGGIGNIEIQGAIDTTELSSDLALRTEKVFISKPPPSTPDIQDSQRVDGQQFSVLISSGGNALSFEISEETAPDELVGLCNELLHEIIRRKVSKP
jgi:hypothetical protein